MSAPPKDILYGPVTWTVSREAEDSRLDRYLHVLFPKFSRSRLQALIRQGAVTVNGKAAKPSHPVAKNDVIRVELPEDHPRRIDPEPIPLDVLYEDDFLLVVNKPAGMVVHPARGNWSGTLVHALLHHCSRLPAADDPSRPGIVHRLDQFTSGVLVCAKNDAAYARLGPQFESRSVEKEYLALTDGEPEFDEDEIDLPLGMDPHDREKVAVRLLGGRKALTRFHVLERLGGFAFLRVEPRTGRTHQIRVHLLSARCPVLCDASYSRRSRLTRADLGLPGEEILLERQALHARRLSLRHPKTEELMTFEAPLPGDMERTLDALRERNGP